MVGPGIWRETLENVQNEKNTLQDLEYGEKKKRKTWKKRHKHFRCWNTVGNTKILQNEKKQHRPWNMERNSE